MSLQSRIRQRGNDNINACITRSIWYEDAPIMASRSQWFIPVLAAASAALIVGIALPFALPRQSVSNIQEPECSSSASGDPQSAFYIAIPERFIFQEVTYQTVFSSDLGRVDASKAGQIAVQGDPYAGIVKQGYETEFEQANPGMPYMVQGQNQFGEYVNYIYMYKVEGYETNQAIMIMTDLFVSFSVKAPNNFVLNEKTYVKTGSLDLGVIDPAKAGTTALRQKHYAAMVKEGYEETFSSAFPAMPYFSAPISDFNETTNFDFIYSIQGYEPSVALILEDVIYKAI